MSRNSRVRYASRYRFHLSTSAIVVTVLCGWLACFQYSVQLFAGVGLVGTAAGWARWRWTRPAHAHIVLHEILAIGLCLSAGLGLIINHFVDF